jgi:hypothetical protein
MIIKNYNNFIFERKLEYFLHSLNEEMTVNEYKSKIQNFVKNLKTKEQAEQFLKKTLDKFKNSKFKKYFVTFLITVVLSTNLINGSEIRDLFRNDSELNIIVVDSLNSVKTKYSKEDFLKKLADFESSGRPNALKMDKRQKHVYIGAFQMSHRALKEVGINIDHNEFKKNPSIFPLEKQKEAVINYMMKNLHYMRNYTHYIGKTINGIKITKSGLLAAAHLVGQRGVKDFLRTQGKTDTVDGNGVPCSHYMKEFSGYSLN